MLNFISTKFVILLGNVFRARVSLHLEHLNYAELRQIGFITLLYPTLLEIFSSWLKTLLGCLANVQ